MRTPRRSGALPRGCRFLSLLCCLFLSAGCGESPPPRQPVSGAVTYDGQPVENGQIQFIPTGDTKGPPGGGMIKDGKYALTSENGPVPGKHKVEILGTRSTGEKIPAVPPATGEIEKTEQYIPAKYNRSTTLEADIKAGANPLDFNLQK